MPEMDGITATTKIRADSVFQDIPVIAMTAHALDEGRDRCLDAGMNDHVSKPIDARDLISKINKWIYNAEKNACVERKTSKADRPRQNNSASN